MLSPTLTILGYNSAIPTIHGTPTAQYLEMAGRGILIDCGEGTQVQLRRAKLKFSKINRIFISHLHGDHCFGLPGLVSSFRLLGREAPLHIYGPIGIQQMLETIFKLSEVHSDFNVHYHELSAPHSELIFEDEKISVHSIPLDHRIYANGYLFKEKPMQRHLNISEIKKYPEIEQCDYAHIKRGEDFILSDGYRLANNKLTTAPRAPKSFAFCSDTRFKPDIVPLIHGADLLYHEATFLENLKEMAHYTGHSTAKEAATIAHKAQVKKLVLGHFSNRYTNTSEFLLEARNIFPETYLPKVLHALEI